jgi:hypothetical protein
VGYNIEHEECISGGGCDSIVSGNEDLRDK